MSKEHNLEQYNESKKVAENREVLTRSRDIEVIEMLDENELSELFKDTTQQIDNLLRLRENVRSEMYKRNIYSLEYNQVL